VQDLLKLYQTVCNYQINECIQPLDIPIDIRTLKEEMLEFITSNKFGFNAVSLRLPKGENNYIDPKEMLESTAYSVVNYMSNDTDVITNNANSEYTEWHPSLRNSYVSKLVPKLEELTGLKIGRIRLGWLQQNAGYPMHVDLEPMRLHIPIITNDLAFFISNNSLYHMDYGKLYHLITTNVHTAHNFGFIPRLHLIFSTYSDNINIEKEIYKLTDRNLRENNFLEHIPQGIDDVTLACLLKLHLAQHKPSESLSDIIYPIQKLRNILNKKN